jgi:deazaflavin-dependent oxidoreductase (nitroreductase family)
MQVPRFMRRVNRAFTNRLMAPLAGVLPPLAIVHHVGRKSGRSFRTPILAFPVAGGTLTPLPYGTDTDWVLNLLAAGGGEIVALGRRSEVENPRVVDAEEAADAVPEALKPLLRRLPLPGFLLLDRGGAGARRHGATRSSRRPGRPSSHH